jgi:hypothetical protein
MLKDVGRWEKVRNLSPILGDKKGKIEKSSIPNVYTKNLN